MKIMSSVRRVTTQHINRDNAKGGKIVRSRFMRIDHGIDSVLYYRIRRPRIRSLLGKARTPSTTPLAVVLSQLRGRPHKQVHEQFT